MRSPCTCKPMSRPLEGWAPALSAKPANFEMLCPTPMKPWSIGWIGLSKVNGFLNCPTFTRKKSYFCHSTKRSTKRGEAPKVEVLPLNCSCAFQYQSSRMRPSSDTRPKRRLKVLDLSAFIPLYWYCTIANPDSLTLLTHLGACALPTIEHSNRAAERTVFFIIIWMLI